MRIDGTAYFSLPVFGEGKGGGNFPALRLWKRNPTLPSPKTGREKEGATGLIVIPRNSRIGSGVGRET
jgi:hypothetical protein